MYLLKSQQKTSKAKVFVQIYLKIIIIILLKIHGIILLPTFYLKETRKIVHLTQIKNLSQKMFWFSYSKKCN
jgi:hypothetical protein